MRRHMRFSTQLARRQALPLLLAASMMVPTLVKADGCDRIDGMAEHWHKLSTYIDDHSSKRGDLSAEQVKKVNKEYRELVPPTREFAVNVSKIDDKQISSLGKQILLILDELDSTPDGDTWDDITPVMDRLVAVIDKLGDACAAGK